MGEDGSQMGLLRAVDIAPAQDVEVEAGQGNRIESLDRLQSRDVKVLAIEFERRLMHPARADGQGIFRFASARLLNQAGDQLIVGLDAPELEVLHLQLGTELNQEQNRRDQPDCPEKAALEYIPGNGPGNRGQDHEIKASPVRRIIYFEYPVGQDQSKDRDAKCKERNQLPSVFRKKRGSGNQQKESGQSDDPDVFRGGSLAHNSHPIRYAVKRR